MGTQQLGQYMARAVVGNDAHGQPICGMRESKEKGTKHIFVLFEIMEGAHKGRRYGWEGWLGENSMDRTLEALTYCGVEPGTNDPDGKPVSLSNLYGLDRNIVPVVLEEEEYKDPTSGQPRKRIRVAWVNNPERGLSIHKPVESVEADAFAARMQGAFMAAAARRQQGKSQRPSADDTKFDFGANAPQSASAQAAPEQNAPAQQSLPTSTPISEEAKSPNPAAGY